ncbi:MAG TPA: beta-galactosidase trimerization domain-containing protein, partial [Candidatus Acidoferrum sp.]|nr:beta-galactosidase trimerization domain-containing protein [Candidatus Acidoferrum sp.]
DQGTKITNSPAFKFLAAATHGKPVVVYATEITPPIFPHPTETCLNAMSQINIAEAVANHTIFREKRLTPAGATQMYRFLATNEESLRDVRLHASVAVVASLRQYFADELSFAFSTSRVLADNGIAHVMLTEDDLSTPAINQFDMVVVPYLPLMSSENQQALVRYAKAGGTLLVLGASGNKDQYGLAQGQIPLAQSLGNGQYPVTDATRRVGKGQVLFVPVQIPASRFLIPMKSHGDYTTFVPTMADVFADIPEGYTRNRIDPELRKLLERVAGRVQESLGPRVTRLTSVAPYVEVTTMTEKADRWMLLHIVNYDVRVDGTITPARNLTVQVAIPRGKTARSVTWSGTLSEMKPMKYTTVSKAGRQMLLLDLDEVSIYGLAKVELE